MRHGADIIARNMAVGDGEIDVLARVRGVLTAVEVRSLGRGRLADPVTAFDRAKAEQVRRLAGQLGVARVDLVAVSLTRSGASLRWVPQAA